MQSLASLAGVKPRSADASHLLLVGQADGILAGQAVADMVLEEVDPSLKARRRGCCIAICVKAAAAGRARRRHTDSRHTSALLLILLTTKLASALNSFCSDCPSRPQAEWTAFDGDKIVRGQKFCTITGSGARERRFLSHFPLVFRLTGSLLRLAGKSPRPAAAKPPRAAALNILVAERIVLNFMQRMSGIATLTAQMAVAAAPARILETRKTVPGLRLLDKWRARLPSATLRFAVPLVLYSFFLSRRCRIVGHTTVTGMQLKSYFPMVQRSRAPRFNHLTDPRARCVILPQGGAHRRRLEPPNGFV